MTFDWFMKIKNILFFLLISGPEYGTMEAAWKGILTEADRLSDVHIKVKENLTVDVMQEIKTWQKDNFHKVNIQNIQYNLLNPTILHK